MRCSAFIFVLMALSGVSFSNPESSPVETTTGKNRRALCMLHTMDHNLFVNGTIEITQECPNQPVFIRGNITVMAEDNVAGEHGFHIHEFAVPNVICAEAAGHYNPFGKDHGGPDDENRHIGDLGNIMITKCDAPDTYKSTLNITDSLVTLFGDHSVLGRSMVMHIGEDDLGQGGEHDSLSTGHAGARMSCCTISIVPALPCLFC